MKLITYASINGVANCLFCGVAQKADCKGPENFNKLLIFKEYSGQSEFLP